ncbi:GNAT family N-acetyltransferase [Croceimicrobium sp.]|uniref:GNAT family N-acetyltransferase n=1 Tax=Croceimicrobium sp. TaxID=2828340 RepID=UPI003BA9C875
MSTNNIYIRESQIEDLANLMRVEELAFGHPKEAQLSADLLKDPSAEPLLSLLAFDKNKAIGHILFTRVYLNTRDNKQVLYHILAPLAIIPEYQKRGIGGLLIEAGIAQLKAMGSELLFVLGHMDYYPKHGFIPDAGAMGFQAPYPIPAEFANAWMVQSLKGELTEKPKGKILCSHELNKEEHWRE